MTANVISSGSIQKNQEDLNLHEKATSSTDDSATQSPEITQDTPLSPWRNFLNIVNWKPPWCRWDPEKPPVFSMPMNILFAFGGCFTVANLYYSHPILNILADEFNVSYEVSSHVPTYAQAGYAAGLFFLCPLGDLFKRRPFVLSLVFFTATFWIGLCITKNFAAFEAISFITGFSTVTPQLMMPLVGDLAPPHKRAAALSVVTAGNLLGILIARLLSGVVTEFTTWRTIYWVALGLQYLIFILLWLFMPDYPSTNPDGLNYFKMLWSVIRMPTKHPVLVQACGVSVATSAIFTSYWTTLTFLLADPPYSYTPLQIGLFALIGIAGMCCTPPFGRIVIGRFVPLFSVALGEVMNLIGVTVGTYTGLRSVVGPAFEAWLIDMGLQTTQIANRSAIYAVEPKGRNRINTVYMVFTFLGQLMGTAVGNHVYARGGWVASGSVSVGFVGASFLFIAARGPWEKGWIGWSGGWSIRKKDKMSADGLPSESTAAQPRDEEEAETADEVASDASPSPSKEKIDKA